MSDSSPDAHGPLFEGSPWSELNDDALSVYEQARISGLCHEGAWEIAVEAMRDDRIRGTQLDLDSLKRSHKNHRI